MVREGVQELDIEQAVKARYSGAALAREPELHCPVSYDPALLVALPVEVLARDHGCGDPSRHLRPGETVLDLGSGAGKICFIASQVVGRSGRVIGVDMNDDMLDLARRNAPAVARNAGYSNVSFGKGFSDIVSDEDVRLDLQRDADLWSGCISGAFREDRRPFPCAEGAIVRSPRETKGDGYDVTTEATPIVCPPGGDCC